MAADILSARRRAGDPRVLRPVARIARRLVPRALIVVAAALPPGCARLGSAPVAETDRATAQFRMVDTDKAWIPVPDILLVLERPLAGRREQRLVLPNATATPGDNVLLLRTRATGTPDGAVDPVRIVADSGGAPAPFAGIDARGLRAARDSLGPYLFAQMRVGPRTFCALAVRSLGQTTGLVPRGAGTLDVMMRNCSDDGARAALAPIQDARLSQSPFAALDVDADGANRTLSPLAAPSVGVLQ